MLVEFREWRGMRMTFAPGMSDPVWLVAELARQVGNVPSAARRLGLRVSRLRAVLHYAQENPRRIAFERAAAREAGFEPPALSPPLPALVFPAEQLRDRNSAAIPADEDESDGWTRPRRRWKRERFIDAA